MRPARSAPTREPHPVLAECAKLKAVLRANPAYGVVVPGNSSLRKMRVRVPGLNKGKSGGYRAIYSKHDTDEGVRIVFHAVFYKDDVQDLSVDQYRALSAEAKEIAASIGSTEWEE
jgi:hypothetical protein